MTGPSVDLFSTVREHLDELCSWQIHEIHWTPMMLLYTFLFSRMGGSLNPKLSYNNRNIGIRNNQMNVRVTSVRTVLYTCSYNVTQVFVQCYTSVRTVLYTVRKNLLYLNRGRKGTFYPEKLNKSLGEITSLKNRVDIKWVILSHINDSRIFYKRFKKETVQAIRANVGVEPSDPLPVSYQDDYCFILQTYPCHFKKEI